MTKLLEFWKRPIWSGSLPTLIHHLLHVTGGISVVFILLAFGVERLLAHFLVTILFTIVEATTAAFQQNYEDSFYDWIQYLGHWPLFFFAVGAPVLAGILLAGWLSLYFSFLFLVVLREDE